MILTFGRIKKALVKHKDNKIKVKKKRQQDSIENFFQKQNKN